MNAKRTGMAGMAEFTPKGAATPTPEAAAPPPPAAPPVPEGRMPPAQVGAVTPAYAVQQRTRARVQLGLRLDDPAYRELRDLCHQLDVKMQVVVEEAVLQRIQEMREYVAKQRGQGGGT